MVVVTGSWLTTRLSYSLPPAETLVMWLEIESVSFQTPPPATGTSIEPLVSPAWTVTVSPLARAKLTSEVGATEPGRSEGGRVGWKGTPSCEAEAVEEKVAGDGGRAAVVGGVSGAGLTAGRQMLA